ncbi:hypothetical protein N4G70_22320 [Streptomyces sp. ASQP_92]|uniref:hypothetical protein n=1 Tax=Streptomyces sp. ASQP_92 TaxID=2979116 RepID=UPI0021C0E5DD|nr:hypothetical protein [Streptomyces sp. ASQP_92]MCT9091583.1 hypothetical protein [Streptomyces sp. ASQP_92]
MPPTPATPRPVRPAAVINERMRELAGHGWWSDAERAEYDLLLVEWAAAQHSETTRADVGPAA